MAVLRMTREEYEAKYGVKAPVSQPQQTEPNYFERVGADLAKRGENITKAVSKGAESFGKEVVPKSLLSAGLQTAGNVAGGALDMIGEGVSSVLKTTGLEKPVSNVVSKIAETSPVKRVTDFYNTLSPQSQANLDSIANIGSILTAGTLSKNLTAKGTMDRLKSAGTSVLENTKSTLTNSGTFIKSPIQSTKNAISDTSTFLKGTKEKVKEKASDLLTPIPQGTEKVLQQTKLPILDKYIKTGQEAIADYSKQTPLELAGVQGEKAVQKLSSQLQTIGRKKGELTEKLATKPIGNVVSSVRESLRQDLITRTGSTLDYTTGKLKSASGRVSSITDNADLKLLSEVDGSLARLGKNPTFRQVDDTIDKLQQLLYERSANTLLPRNTKVEGILKKNIRTLNDSLKSFATKNGAKDYVKYNDAYARYLNAQTKLSKLLGAEGGKGGALMKRVFSPSDAGTKKLFNEVKTLTKGQYDLISEATLAKFVMENLGDARQASLLEEVIRGNLPITKTGFIQAAGEKLIQKLQNPIEKARRISGGGTTPFSPEVQRILNLK